MHHPLHTGVLLYLLMVAVPSAILRLLIPDRPLAAGCVSVRRGVTTVIANSSRPPWSAGSSTEPPRFSRTPRGGQYLDDVAGVRQGAREPVELGEQENVAGARDDQRLAQGPAGADVPVRQWSTQIWAASTRKSRGRRVGR